MSHTMPYRKISQSRDNNVYKFLALPPSRLPNSKRHENFNTILRGFKARQDVTTKFDIEKPRLMMTSSNGNIFRVTGPLRGNPPVTGGFPSQRPVVWGFDIYFDLRLNKRLNEQSNPGDLRRHQVHYDVTVIYIRDQISVRIHRIHTIFIVSFQVGPCTY